MLACTDAMACCRGTVESSFRYTMVWGSLRRCAWYECWYNNTTVLLGTELGGVIVRTRVELGSASGADG